MSFRINTLMTIMVAMFAAGPSGAEERTSQNAHQFDFRSATGDKIDLADFAGKAVLIVNTASQCSFTKQYGPLQTLYEKYKDRGFVVVAIPSDDFGGQEPGSDAEIVEFATNKFEVGFPIASKARVKGSQADPFYRWAVDQVGAMGKPRWNFHKYLIGPEGEMVTWFSTFTEPDSQKLANSIEAILPDNREDSES